MNGIEYLTAEHWMMAEKARLFGDEGMLGAILAAQTPKEAKSLGRKVGDFDPDVWNENKFDIVVRGNYQKFTQHQDLKNYLLATSAYVPPAELEEANDHQIVREQPVAYRTSRSVRAILVEAAGRDVIWGIGLGKNNPKSQNPLTWRGRNLLGFALTLVREQISSELLGDDDDG